MEARVINVVHVRVYPHVTEAADEQCGRYIGSASPTFQLLGEVTDEEG